MAFGVAVELLGDRGPRFRHGEVGKCSAGSIDAVKSSKCLLSHSPGLLKPSLTGLSGASEHGKFISRKAAPCSPVNWY